VKEEGHLGVRDLVSWNKAASIKLIWMLFSTSGSIWVVLFVDTVLSGDISNFWTIKENNNHSWLVKRLFRLRAIVYPWLCIDKGNGITCRFWSDNWSPFGSIKEFLNLPPPSRLGIPMNATLADLNDNGNWLIPAARSEEQVLLQAHLSTVWHTVGTRSGLSVSPSWNQTLLTLQQMSRPRHAKLLCLLVWQSTIYNIWSERNARLRRIVFHPPDSIESYIRHKIGAIRSTSPKLSSSLFQFWHR
ncbi:hypothetical protein N665_0113s0013, partial [Sinapis alba]